MTTYYVSTTGNNAADGLTTATAWATITRAGSAGSIVTGGDFVNVLPGTYAKVTTFKSGISKASRITYRNDPFYAPWSARISGASGLAWQNQGHYINIEDFYVTGAACSAGILSDEWTLGLGRGSVTTISGCKIENLLTNGVCGSQGGVRTQSGSSSCVVSNCIIGNIAAGLVGTCNTTHGIYIAGVGDRVENCLVYNCASVGIQQWHGAGRSTIIDNTTFGSVHGILIGQGDAGVNGGSKNNFVANNISCHNTRVGIYGIAGTGTGSNIYRNNCCFSNPEANFTLTSTDLNSNPVTVDAKFKNFLASGAGDYHLSSTSACRNAGVDHGSASLGDATFPVIDLDGNSRPMGTAYDIGAYEFVEGVTDTTPPTLTSPAGNATGTTTASVSVSTNENTGTLYVWITTNATETAANIVLNGATQTVTVAGTQTRNITGLTASTTYYAHFVHTDAATNQSAAANSAAFTTDTPVDTTPPVLSLPTGAATGTTTAQIGVTTDEGNGTMYYYVSVNATETAATIVANGLTFVPTSASGKIFSWTGLTAATTYYAHFVQDDAALNRSNVVNSTSFTTNAIGPSPSPGGHDRRNIYH